MNHWMAGLRNKWKRSRSGEQAPQGTFVVESQFERSEELRTDVLGVPSEDEIRDDRPHDPWRPARTLGPIRRR